MTVSSPGGARLAELRAKPKAMSVIETEYTPRSIQVWFM